jgi:5-methyltetrahydrofolate--homocysteine methyltransferase
MGALLEKLERERYLVSDGAWGTVLQAKGLKAGECPEEWNISHPDAVRSVARDYAAAGSDMVLTNTFGGSPIKLKRYGLEDKADILNREGGRLSLEGAPGSLVAASVGPTGEFLSPLGEMTEEELRKAFREQISAILESGVRAVCVETMTAVEEAVCAVTEAKDLDPAVEVICTMTFDPTPQGFRTMMGVDIQRAVEELEEAGADVLGANCGNGIEQMIPIAKEMRSLTQKPILIHANAGLPQLRDGETVFLQTPEAMSARIRDLLTAGCRIVGGCCGTEPGHIRAIRAEVDRFRNPSFQS